MTDENLNPDDSGNDDHTSLLGDNPPTDDNNDDNTDDNKPEVKYELGEDGEPKLDDDGNKIEIAADEDYTDFTLPEGMEVDSEFLGQGTAVLKDLGLNQEQAQKVVDLYANQVAAQGDMMNTQIKTWQSEARSNKEYGGDAFNANVALAKSALDKFGDDNLVTMLNDTGIGNHPALIGLLVKVGKMTAEDNPDLGDRGGDKLSREDIMYPDANKT